MIMTLDLCKFEFYKNFLGYRLYRCIQDNRAEQKRLGRKATLFACTQLDSHKIFVYDEFFNVPEEVQLVILIHEIAHIKGIMDEQKADQFAAEHIENGHYWLERARIFTEIFNPIVKKRLGME